MFNTRHLYTEHLFTPSNFYTKHLLDRTPHPIPIPLRTTAKKKYKSRAPFFLEKSGTLLFTSLVLLDPSAGKLYPPTSLPLRSLLPCSFCISSPSDSRRTLKPRSPSVASSHAISAAPPPAFSAYTQTSLPLRSLLPCYFCSSSPSDSQRTLKPRSPSVASSHAISAAPAPAILSVHSNLAPPP